MKLDRILVHWDRQLCQDGQWRVSERWFPLGTQSVYGPMTSEQIDQFIAERRAMFEDMVRQKLPALRDVRIELEETLNFRLENGQLFDPTKQRHPFTRERS